MIRLCYTSTLDVQVTDRRYSRVLMEMLAATQRQNKSHGVTGVLLISGNTCLQVLEGKASSVSLLMYKINRDRHQTDVEIITKTTIEERIFDRWSMRLHGDCTESFVTSIQDLYRGDESFKHLCKTNTHPHLRVLCEGVKFSDTPTEATHTEDPTTHQEDHDYENCRLSITTWPKASQMVLNSQSVKLLSKLSGQGAHFDHLQASGIFSEKNELKLMLDSFYAMGVLRIEREPEQPRYFALSSTRLSPRKQKPANGFAKAMHAFLGAYAQRA